MDYPLLWVIVAAALVTQVATFSTSIYLHRTETHQSLKMNRYVTLLFRFFLWVTTGIVRKNWVAIHRKHHAFTDKDGDPHSPLLKGFWSVQLGNVVHYVRATKEAGLLEKYAPDMVKDDLWDRWLFNRGQLGLAVGIAILCVVMVFKWGLPGLGWGMLAALIHAVTYVFVISSSINGLCHVVGYKNFNNPGTNLRFVALASGGGGLHKNHHAHPRNPKFSVRPSEFDPSWAVIRPLTALNLAEPYRDAGGLK